MKTWIAKIKDSGPWIVFFEIFVIAQLLLIFVFNLTHLNMKQALIPPPPWRRQWKSGIRKAFF